MLTFQQKKEFIMTQLFQAQSLDSSEKLVALCMVFKYIDDRGRCVAPIADLAKMARRHRRTIERIINSLEKKINLDVTYKNGTVSVYTFIQWAEL
jgi:hypothetical protein|tara:strand:+ start:548 stop:832 length:285 start_codon:yes stop_codon:yes gene_type:complete